MVKEMGKLAEFRSLVFVWAIGDGQTTKLQVPM